MAAAELLIMPSYFESLSMVALEAWALGRPVLANGRCDVLKGQCIRSNAGLYYENLRRVRRDAARDRAQPVAERGARPERPPVLPRALRLAGHRAEVSRHARAAVEASRRTGHRAAARLVRATPASDCPAGARGGRRRSPAGPGRSQRAGRRRDRRRPRVAAPTRPSPPQAPIADPAPSATSGDTASPRTAQARSPTRRQRRRWRRELAASGGPPGAGDARLRRRDRPRGARHPARAARRRLRVGDLRRNRRPAARAADPRLPRAGRRQPSRQPAAPSLFDRLEGVAHRVRAAGSDGAHLPQHHAAGVLRRRPPHAGAAVLSRPARAAGVRRSLRSGARRLGVQPAGSRSARISADRRAAGRPGLLASRSARRTGSSPTSSTTTGPTSCSSAG